tara:strand:+ start:8232 stop:9308 length:1077 start_codon:yes stop_codon:yes gene_type:complete
LKFVAFAEDPGGANYLIDLAKYFEIGEFSLFGYGIAKSYFDKLGVLYQDFSNVEEISEKINSKGVFVFVTSENVQSPAFEIQSSLNNILSVAIVDAPTSLDWRFRGSTNDSFCHIPDYLVVPDEGTKEWFIENGIDEKKISVIQNPKFNRAQRIAKEVSLRTKKELKNDVLGVNSDIPIFLFLGELSTGLNQIEYRKSDEYTLHGFSDSNKRTEIVVEEFIIASRALSYPVHLVYRPHPKESLKDYKTFIDLFDAIDLHPEPIESCLAANFVVGLTGSLLEEVASLGQSCLSIVPREKERVFFSDHYTNLIECVWNREELNKAISFFSKDSSVSELNLSRDIPDSSLELAKLLRSLAH